MQDVIGDVDILQDLAQILSHYFFPHVGQITFSPVSGAVVIDVFPFLDFSGHRAFIKSASEQA